MTKSYIPILLIIFLQCCPFLQTSPSSVSVPAEATKQRPRPTPTSYESLTMKEAWKLAEPEVKAWAPDARMGMVLKCEGVMDNNGRCNHWYGNLGSASQQEMAQLDIQGKGVTFEPVDGAMPVMVNPILDNAFDVEPLLDTPEAIERAMAWLEAEGLRQDRTRVRVLSLKSTSGALEACQVSSAPIYRISFFYPDGQLCLDPYDGRITYTNFR